MALRRRFMNPIVVASAEPEPPAAVPLDAPSEPSRASLAGALNSVSAAVVVTDPSGRLIFTNRVASSLFAATDERSLVRDATKELLVSAGSGSSVERAVELFGPPASTFLIRAAPWQSADGQLGGSVALVEDLSERHRLDQLRRDFVANISHELKTPVGAVGLLADALQTEVDSDLDAMDPAVVRRLVGRITVEMSRLAVTIDDLLVLSRAEAGDELALEDVEIEDLLDDACSRLSAAAESRSIDLTWKSETDLTVLGDRRQLLSALTNLVDNALKYSGANQTVSIEARGDDGHARIEVTDHGVGIPARDLARVFERFYRVDRGRSRDTGGTGLGLAIVRHIVANHAGTVEVQSREGRGSVFAMVLPTAHEDDES